MHLKTHSINEVSIAEVTSDDVLITTIEDGVDLLGNLYYQGFDKVILHKKHITPAFFDLKNGLAGEILQKFSNYRVRLALVGDFSEFSSTSLKDFIYESNKGKQINFVASTKEALTVLSIS
jgi:hypothetical protein